MKNIFASLCLGVIFLAASTVSAQNYPTPIAREKKHDVEIGKSVLSLSGAQLDKVVFRDDTGILKEDFQLSFYSPDKGESWLANNRLALTAFNKDGSVFGMQVWGYPKGFPKQAFSEANGRVTLPVSSKLERAESFRLDVLESKQSANGTTNLTQTTCQECVNLANGTCGSGGVQSLKCSNARDGSSSCEFTCRPR